MGETEGEMMDAWRNERPMVLLLCRRCFKLSTILLLLPKVYTRSFRKQISRRTRSRLPLEVCLGM